ncbi:hypothetical protein [Shimia sp. SK013]|uniref:hypothetical protein n=1 Tax=Shimia sp. SK013 TaxID=1389006 RepID=UPI00128FABE5|nr:hypothetical protein [Shimia sp. SK013]
MYATLTAHWGVSDKWQISANVVSLYGLSSTARGLLSTNGVGTVGVNARYQIGEYGDWGVSLLGAIEYVDWQVRVPVGGRTLTGAPAGSLHLPVTYKASKRSP